MTVYQLHEDHPAQRILVINPNSNTEVTRAMDEALGPLRTNDAPRIDCVTISEGPIGVESQRDADEAAPHVTRTIAAAKADSDAFVIACYSDPGLRSSREVTEKPIYGIAETGIATAIALGGRIGVISILPTAVDRHWAYARSLDLDDRIVADVPVDLTVAELANEDKVTAQMLDVAHGLRDQHDANVIVLGCAGMARYRYILEEELGIPVIDPTQAAVGAAITALRLGYRGLNAAGPKIG
jgi:allantoin racemase